MAWAYLFVAGLMEIAWAVGLKYTHGFTRLLPSALINSAMGPRFRKDDVVDMSHSPPQPDFPHKTSAS